MCDKYTPCHCLRAPTKDWRVLTLLLLDCWQREYDKRPYRNFIFKRLEFEDRMNRKFDYVRDFEAIVQFFEKRILCSVKLVGIDVEWHEFDLLRRLVASLYTVRYIKLHMMSLPTSFFSELVQWAPSVNWIELSLEGTHLRTEHIALLRAFLLLSNCIESLNVSNCDIDQYDFALIADGVHKCPTMRRVNFTRLVGNGIYLDTPKMAQIVSELIWQNKLTEITIQHCEFLAHDMEIIGEYIANPESVLRLLDVAYNRIGPDGLKHLLVASVKGSRLRHLNVSGNGLGEHGGEQVAKYLSSSYSLEHLDITYNRITANAINLILTTMKKPVKVIRLNLWGNSYNEKTGTVLRRLLSAHVVLQEWIDVTVTYDDTLGYYRVIPYY